MKKHLFYHALWGVLTLSLMSSCRTEDGAVQQKQNEAKYFKVFIPKKENEAINYPDGFAFLMKRYDELHKTNLSGINNNIVIGNLTARTDKSTSFAQSNDTYVETKVHSVTFTADNGDKWVIFPKVQGLKVVELVIGLLTDKATYVRYSTYGEQSGLFKDYGQAFQDGFNRYQAQIRNLNLNAGINSMSYMSETEIEEVVIPGRKKPNTPGSNDNPPDPGSGPSGECGAYFQCDFMNPEGAGGSGGTDTPPADMAVPPPPKIPIIDIKKYLSCFDQTKSANLTVYAQNMTDSPPGHAFITLQQGNNTMTFGFYPRDPYLNSLSGRGIMGEDGEHPYNQALNVGAISPAQLQNIISRAIDYASTRYDLAVRNCADFAREALNIANVPGANWDSNWSRPTDIANIINSQKSGVTGKGNAPATRRSCNN